MVLLLMSVTNSSGPMRYIREALKIFLPPKEGVIINVSSVNGMRPFCGATEMPAYLANKEGKQPYACLYLASEMRRHVKGQVIQVCIRTFL